MDLKKMMKEKEQQINKENNSAERMELIQELKLQISNLQSENQSLLQTLKDQDMILKEQTRYFEESKKNEKDNKRLLKVIRAACKILEHFLCGHYHLYQPNDLKKQNPKSDKVLIKNARDIEMFIYFLVHMNQVNDFIEHMKKPNLQI